MPDRACFGQRGHNRHVAKSLHTIATVTLEKGEKGFAISGIALKTEAQVPGISAADFQTHAEATRTGCIVSRALASVPITLEAKLL